jgi:hypothetical protein
MFASQTPTIRNGVLEKPKWFVYFAARFRGRAGSTLQLQLSPPPCG